MNLQLLGLLALGATLFFALISVYLWRNLGPNYKVWAIIVMGVWCTVLSIGSMLWVGDAGFIL
jgi:hypothetical protein